MRVRLTAPVPSNVVYRSKVPIAYIRQVKSSGSGMLQGDTKSGWLTRINITFLLENYTVKNGFQLVYYSYILYLALILTLVGVASCTSYLCSQARLNTRAGLVWANTH